jgi:hypothetical protein
MGSRYPDGSDRERGFSSVTVPALVVLAAGVLAGAALFSGSADGGVAQEANATRVMQAAHAGLEWGRQRVEAGVVPSCVAVTHFSIPLDAGTMPVTVRCLVTGTHTEGGATVNTYQLSATACTPSPAGCPNGARGPHYVERTVSGIARR